MAKYGSLTTMTRDYLFEQSSNGNPETLPEIAKGIEDTRAFVPHAGALRKSLNQLIKDNWVVLDDAARPATYRWNKVAGTPPGYTPRTAVPKTTTINATQNKPTTKGTPVAATDQRAELRGMLKDRLDDVTGARQKAEEMAEVPKGKRPKRVVKRPNGKEYMMRELSGGTDVDGLRKLRENGIFPLLYGPPGTGKTALVEAAFATELHTITGDENTNTADFIGQWAPTDDPNKWFWVDGPLIKAMKNGEVLFVDDITLIDPRVLAVMYPAMDGRDEVILKEHIVRNDDGEYGPGVMKVKPGFFIVGAHNPGVHGAILTDALSSRFRAQILIETDLELAASLATPERMLRLVKQLRAERENDAGLWVPQLREMLAFRDISLVWGEEAAAANLLALAPEGPDRDKVAHKMRTVFSKDIKQLELGGQL